MKLGGILLLYCIFGSFGSLPISILGKVFLNEPNYKNSNRSLSRSLERTENDNMSSYGYKTEKTGFSFGTSYEQYREVFFSPTFETTYEDISTNSSARSSWANATAAHSSGIL